MAKNPPLEERINGIRDEIEAFITARVAEIKKHCENVPEGVIRQTIVGRNAGCLCESYLAIQQSDETENAA